MLLFKYDKNEIKALINRLGKVYEIFDIQIKELLQILEQAIAGKNQNINKQPQYNSQQTLAIFYNVKNQVDHLTEIYKQNKD